MVNNSGIEVDIEAATAEADESSDDPVTLSNFISGQFPTVRNSPVETPLKKEDLASTVPPPEQAPAVNNVIVVTDLSSYSGATLEEQVDDFLTSHSVIVVATSTCPFCRDVKDLLANEIGVETYILNVDSVPDGSKILAYIKKTTGQKTVPVCFIRGTFIGGCDTLKALHAQGDLEGKLLYGLVNRQRTAGTERLATSHLIAPERSQACHPLFWFPNVVNNYVIRVVGFQVCALSVVSAVFLDDLFAHWIAAGLLVDFCLRTLAGASASPLGMIATLITSPVRPLFKPGPPKQFASVCGIMFSGLGTIFYFVEFEGHQYFGMAFMAMLAGASGLEWALDFCLGCKFYSIGIWMGLIPDYVYRIYTSSKQETEDSWDYVFQDSHAPGPEKVDTDPTTPISLKYKHKTDEWSKDDFDGVRHMQVTYFAMPLGITGLAVAFKIASTWSLQFYQAVTGNDMEQRSVVVHDEWFQVIASIGAFVFLIMLFLYAIRMVFYTHKCMTEWDCPLRSPSFGAISITMMLFSFLLYDEIDYDPRDEEPSQIAARVIFWVGAVAHVLLTVSKMGEWIARRMELEHVHAQWMILPVGLSVAALVAPIVPLFAEETSNAVGTIFIARFFYSFAVLMWITLFVITFFKVVTTHNSDTRIRYGIFIWLAAPCVLGLADFSICVSDGMGQQCVGQFANYYFIGIFMFLCILWSSLPHLAFVGSDKWDMAYWIACFALDALAACAALFYTLTSFRAAETLQFIALASAGMANFVCLMHTLTAIVRRRGVFTPEQKWGPLSFMKLTHEAFRGNMSTLRKSLDVLDLENKNPSDLNLFAAHLNRFNILHDEHSKHEDEVIFKTFNDFFHDHAKKFNSDHEHYHETMHQMEAKANLLLDHSLGVDDRQAALDWIKKTMPAFFDEFEEHLRGEELDLQPIGRKYLPLEIQKQISRKVFDITPAEKWEIIIPYVINNLPRHPQRVRYLKVLLWSMPERGQQIGSIVYRNVDAVMWERLRIEVPEIIPRSTYNWKRYY